MSPNTPKSTRRSWNEWLVVVMKRSGSRDAALTQNAPVLVMCLIFIIKIVLKAKKPAFCATHWVIIPRMRVLS